MPDTMSEPLYSIVYTSRAVKPFSVEELDELLKKARANNKEVSVTGMLVHLAGAFMQVLEGSKEAVTYLFRERIARDERHSEVEVATEGPINERKFGDWTMAFKNFDLSPDDRPEGFSDFVKEGFTTELASDHKALSAAILNNFRRKFGPLDESWGS